MEERFENLMTRAGILEDRQRPTESAAARTKAMEIGVEGSHGGTGGRSRWAKAPWKI